MENSAIRPGGGNEEIGRAASHVRRVEKKLGRAGPPRDGASCCPARRRPNHQRAATRGQRRRDGRGLGPDQEKGRFFYCQRSWRRGYPTQRFLIFEACDVASPAAPHAPPSIGSGPPARQKYLYNLVRSPPTNSSRVMKISGRVSTMLGRRCRRRGVTLSDGRAGASSSAAPSAGSI